MSYREQFFALQPPGQALPTAPDSVWGRLLDGLSLEYDRVEIRSGELVRESDPRQSVELLPDWERVCGLPGGDRDEIFPRLFPRPPGAYGVRDGNEVRAVRVDLAVCVSQ